MHAHEQGAAAPGERVEGRAVFDLARELRAVTIDGAAVRGLDYERASMRVQTSGVGGCEETALALAARSRRAGPDRVRDRLAALQPADPASASARAWRVLVWLRSAPAADELAAVHLRADATPDVRAAALRDLLDALAAAPDRWGLASAEERAAWSTAAKASAARRQWARLRVREAWSVWFGERW